MGRNCIFLPDLWLKLSFSPGVRSLRIDIVFCSSLFSCFLRPAGTYKIPTANDVPVNLHIELWKGGQNSKAIFSSKGVGEPPLFMGATGQTRARRRGAALLVNEGRKTSFVHLALESDAQ